MATSIEAQRFALPPPIPLAAVKGATVAAPFRRLRQKLGGMQIVTGTAVLLSVNIGLLLAVCLLFFTVRAADTAVEDALRARADRLEIVNELGRATTQLSRVARAFAVTGEPRYRAYYDDMLAIREGRTARPDPYDRTYWDLVIAGMPQRANGRAVSILQLGREAGFRPRNLMLFERAKQAGDAIIAVERDAMREPSASAQETLFSSRHAVATAAVMKPLDTLLRLVEKGSDSTVVAVQARASAWTTLLLATLCLAAVVALASSWSLVVRVVRPLSRLSAAMTHTVRERDDRPIPYIDRRDEIGQLASILHGARATIRMRERIHDAELQTTTRRDEEAAGHARALRDAAARNARAEAVETLVHGFTGDLLQAMTAVQEASSQLNECAQTMTQVAHGTERRVGEVEQGGRDTTANVDTVASACRQLARATGEIEIQTNKSISSADRAVEAVRRTGATVDLLRLNSERIQGIVALIGRIATKTNRLAINATIEAAHAGTAGRGFAVVAAEVKSLARQTAAAADEISDQLGAVRAASHETVLMVDDITSSIAESREITLAIGSAVEQQANATSEISRNADRAAERTRQSATSMATIRVTTGHTHAAIARMIEAASVLTGTSEAVTRFVDRFADDVRKV